MRLAYMALRANMKRGLIQSRAFVSQPQTFGNGDPPPFERRRRGPICDVRKCHATISPQRPERPGVRRPRGI